METISQLEIFPDELFLELFSYLSPIDLYQCWRHFNSRFLAIVRSVRIAFELIEDLNLNQEILNYFSSQIVYLHLRIPCQTIDFHQVPYLRSLILDTKLTPTQRNSIQSNILPKLERLTLDENSKDQNKFYEQIFNEIYSKKWIKTLHLPYLPNYFLNSNQFAFIQTMIFNRMTVIDVHLILSIQKFLKRLKVTIVSLSSAEKEYRLSQINTKYRNETLIDFHTIMNTYNQIDEICDLLSHLSQLKYLHIDCDGLKYQDFQRLANELNKHMPNLKVFNCRFRQTYVENINDIHCLSPLFYRMKQKKIEWVGGWHYYCITTRDI